MIKAIRGMRHSAPETSGGNGGVRGREVLTSRLPGDPSSPARAYELFARSIGADTDIVAKEMYTFPTARAIP